MNQLDVFYRAFLEYKKQTKDDRKCSILRTSVASNCHQSDELSLTKTVCTIEEDWINEIDKGLKFIGKAIDESRQFILSLGEIKIIENVKRVSRESIEHLSKHVDFITRVPSEEEDLIPDKLYTVERLNDFAVYENRFLYMLLCYLKSFIEIRYDKIIDLTNAYSGSLSMNKSLSIGRNKLTFNLKMTDDRKDDWFIKEHNPLKEIITRIDNQLKTVLFYLETPLMQEVAKVAILKPPITKTNVLKMNENFKGAMDLYDFVSAYDKLGYKVETVTERQSPFPFNASEEIAEVVMLTSFLAYKHNLKIEKYLKLAFEEENERRRALEQERLRHELERLKERLLEFGDDPTEYILMLERQNKSLEADSKSLASARLEIQNLKLERERLIEDVARLSAELLEREREIVAINQAFTEKIAALIKAHADEIETIESAHAAKLREIASMHLAEIDSLKRANERAIDTIKSLHKEEIERRESVISGLGNRLTESQLQHEKELLETKERHAAETERLVAECNLKVMAATDEAKMLSTSLESIKGEKAITEARLLALRRENNLITKDEEYTTQAAFDELEHQLNVFKGFVKSEWKKTKKRIRSEVFKQELGKHKTQPEATKTEKNMDESENAKTCVDGENVRAGVGENAEARVEANEGEKVEAGVGEKVEARVEANEAEKVEAGVGETVEARVEANEAGKVEAGVGETVEAGTEANEGETMKAETNEGEE